MREPEIYATDVQAALLRYSDMVYKISLSQTKHRHDADDVFQEVFLRLITHANTITSEEHLKAWLIRVTLNCCKKHYKLWKRNHAALPDDIPCFTPEDNGIYHAVLALPFKYRIVIHLFYYEGFSVKEISDYLHTKESTIKSQLFRGRQLLKEALKGEFEDFVESI